MADAAHVDLGAARAELNEADRRQQEIDRQIADIEARLEQRKLARKAKPVQAGAGRGRGGGGRGSGRMTSSEQRIENSLNAQLTRLRQGLLPGEPNPAAPPRMSNDEAAAAARANSQHHAAPPPVPAGRTSSGAAGGAAGGAIDDAEDDAGDNADCLDEGEEDADFKQYYAVPSHQKAFNLKAAKEWHTRSSVRAHGAVMRPPDLALGGCQIEHVGLGAVHMHSPNKFLKLPHPPCWRCKWPSVDSGKVSVRGRCPARRVYADEIDEWVVGDKMVCSICKQAHDSLQQDLDELKDAYAGDPSGAEEEMADLEAKLKDATYTYRSYDSRSLKIYAERYGWYVASLPYIILNKRTAVTRPLSRRIMRACSRYSNPTDLAAELLEYKSEAFTNMQLYYYGFHVWASKHDSGEQLTMEAMLRGRLEILTPEGVGLCSPGDALIRHFFDAVATNQTLYQLSWRQQNVPVSIAAVDASYKRGKVLDDLTICQTVWSNDINAPAISAMVNSASMDDPAFAAACEEYCKVVRKLGLGTMKLMYLDCPLRDSGGARRRFPSLASEGAKEHVFDMSKATLVASASEVPSACALFNDAEAVGVDGEWRAPRSAGSSRGKVATLQIGDGKDVCVIFHLTSIGSLPAALVSLLSTNKLAGVNIANDLSNLSADYPEANLKWGTPQSAIKPENVLELSTLAVDVIRCPPAQCQSLKVLFERCFPDLILNKTLCHAKGPRFVNWEVWPLGANEAAYAATDADASARIALRLLHPPTADAVPRQPPPPPPAAPPTAPSPAHVQGGAEAFDALQRAVRDALVGGDGEDNEDEDDADADAAADAADGASSSAASFATRKTVLDAAAQLVGLWHQSGEQTPLELPTFLTSEDRGALHSMAENYGLNHETCGKDGGQDDYYIRISRRAGGGGGGAAGGGGVAGGGSAIGNEIMATLNFIETWKDELVKYDARHFMGNVFLLCQSKSSALFKYFCTAVSDAMFEVREGERERVKKHLRILYKQKTKGTPAEIAADKERVDGLIKRVRRSYWRSHCRYTIPEPQRLARRLLLVYEFFKELDDPETQQPFFAPNHKSVVKKELEYVAAGHLSDHPTFELYVIRRVYKTGYVQYRCLRSSSALEGYHQHLEHSISVCAKGASLRYTDLVMNEFNWRWIVRALRVARLLPQSLQHYHLALVDAVYDLGEKLFGAGGGRRVVPGWRRSKLMAPPTYPLVRQGIYYGMQCQKRDGAAGEAAATSSAAARQTEAVWLGEQLGAASPLRVRRTAEDIDVLMDGAVDLTDAQGLSDRAFDHGLHLPSARAEKLGEEVLADERARSLLEDSGYAELQQKIRTRAPPRPPAALPSRGAIMGTLPLPGPQPAMMVAARPRPAVLVHQDQPEEGMEEEEGGGEEEGVGGGGDDGDDDSFIEVDLQVRRGWSAAAQKDYVDRRKRYNERKRMRQPGKRSAKNQGEARRKQTKKAAPGAEEATEAPAAAAPAAAVPTAAAVPLAHAAPMNAAQPAGWMFQGGIAAGLAGMVQGMGIGGGGGGRAGGRARGRMYQ